MNVAVLMRRGGRGLCDVTKNGHNSASLLIVFGVSTILGRVRLGDKTVKSKVSNRTRTDLVAQSSDRYRQTPAEMCGVVVAPIAHLQ